MAPGQHHVWSGSGTKSFQVPSSVRYHFTGDCSRARHQADSEEEESCDGPAGQSPGSQQAGPGVIASLPGVASPAACQELIHLCEEAGFGQDNQGGSYAQATTDLEVDSCPAVRSWLQSQGLVTAVSRCMLKTHGCRPTAFDDVFVVRYDAMEQRDLLSHVDGADVSFMLALSPREAYGGGGTIFDVPGCSSEPLHLGQGELLLFDAHLYHAGRAISRGRRYLLVGFCFVGAASSRAPGAIGLSLKRLKGGGSRLDLLHLTGPAEDSYWLSPAFLRSAADLCRRHEDSSPASSSWVGAHQGTAPGTLAAFAQAVLRLHAARLGLSVGPAGGAEVWVQMLRPGPAPCDEPEGIPWHFDKDEELHRCTGRLRHPEVATVTYLTACGAPTVVFGERDTLVVHPQQGHHLVFAGDLLHGCPASGRATGQAERGGTPGGLHGLVMAPRNVPADTRTTVLVNLWLGGPPVGVAGSPCPGCLGGLGTGQGQQPSLTGGQLTAEPVRWEEVGVALPALGALSPPAGPDDLLNQPLGATEPRLDRALRDSRDVSAFLLVSD